MNCKHPKSTAEELVRGKCNDCIERDHTCTVCGKRVEHVMIRAEGGKEVSRGHENCINIQSV